MKKWWYNCTSIRRYMPEADHVSVNDIINEFRMEV